MKKVIRNLGGKKYLQEMSEGDIFEFYIPSNLFCTEKRREVLS